MTQKEAEEIKNRIFKVLLTFDYTKISSVHLIHTASKIKNELKDINNPNYNTLDLDGDWIDDEVLNSTYTTFKNTHQALLDCLKDIGNEKVFKYLNIIGTLLDKKDWEASSHRSMIRANKLLRNYVEWLCINDPTYKWICVSVWTIATERELEYRKNWEHEYWLKEDIVVDSILERNIQFTNEYVDANLYVYNPKYDSYYKNETDSQMTERFKREIGLI